MPKHLKIDFISDIACPFCAIGLKGLDEALASLADEVDADLIFHPFEINPDLPPEGQNVGENLREKYGEAASHLPSDQPSLSDRAKEVGVDVALAHDDRFYNTFDAHRLLHWAKLEGKQRELKQALFTAYLSEKRDVSDHAVLADIAQNVGLEREGAAEVLQSGKFSRYVRMSEEVSMSRGINAVPAIIVNDQYLISGGQPAAVFAHILRQIAAKIE
ncbi:putative DsbA family dithiol-disulfide isomerase [Sphingobium xanthum]|uniref:DsbA family oxidoreductase n=1 Tax=Sphingobium xanthum TaxID=1387165 RepID=UPI001C8B2F6D|nr:DsbA family oxidoreductase [Sphingobium xanthum]